MKRGQRQITEIIELPNQERIRTFREKENYKYLGILRVYTIKQVEIKNKIKSTSDEQESSSKPSSAEGISWKE